MRTIYIALLTATLYLWHPATVLAQDTTKLADKEIKTEVPELTSFHTVIYKIWHNAWPKRDVSALAAVLPDVEKGAAKIEQAKLPGILREKKNLWEENVKKLTAIVAEYRDAVAKSDSQRVLDAAEKLHAQYEALVRVIRPVLKELDAFHQTLYMLYHYYMPAYDVEKIRSSVEELQRKMEDLNKATLPKRLEKRQSVFEEKRKELDEAVRNLAEITRVDGDEKAVKDAINLAHDKYQALQEVFD